MGKNDWPDFEAIIEKAVNAGRIQGSNAVKDAFKATERRLYALPVLRAKVAEDRERLKEIETCGTPEHSRSIVRYTRSGSRLAPEEILEVVIKDLKATIAVDEHEIQSVERALECIEGDDFFSIVCDRYFRGLTDDKIANSMNCDSATVWRHRKRLVQTVSTWLYGASSIL